MHSHLHKQILNLQLRTVETHDVMWNRDSLDVLYSLLYLQQTNESVFKIPINHLNCPRRHLLLTGRHTAIWRAIVKYFLDLVQEMMLCYLETTMKCYSFFPTRRIGSIDSAGETTVCSLFPYTITAQCSVVDMCFGVWQWEVLWLLLFFLLLLLKTQINQSILRTSCQRGL